MAAKKSVLVSFGERSRVVSFSGGRKELIFQIQAKFSDVYSASGEEVYLQVLKNKRARIYGTTWINLLHGYRSWILETGRVPTSMWRRS